MEVPQNQMSHSYYRKICSECGSMSGGARWLLGMAQCMFDVYGMGYFGELTKLRAYGFQFMFQVLPDRRQRARDDRIAHTMISALFDFDVFWMID